MNCIDATQVRTISNYRRRLDVDAQVAELDDLEWQQAPLMRMAREVLAPHDEEVQWLGLNALATVWRMFESTADDPLPTLDEALLQGRYQQLHSLIANLPLADERIAERIVKMRYARQPHVMGYVESQCLSYGSAPQEKPLGDAALATVFALVGAAVDLLHLAIDARPFAGAPVRRLPLAGAATPTRADPPP